jgi:hypothetical protein
MPSTIKNMSLGEKASLAISVLSFLVAFIGLTLSENITSIIQKATIVATDDSINLQPFINSKNHLKVLKITNHGNAASQNIKITIKFHQEIPKLEIISDEDIENKKLEGTNLNIYLSRFSSNSSLKIIMFSEKPISYESNYIDNSGNHTFEINKTHNTQNIADIIMLLIVTSSLLVIFWIYRKASETTLIEALRSQHNEMQEKIRELRDEIGNIEITVTNNQNITAPREQEINKGIGQRLADFMTKI